MLREHGFDETANPVALVENRFPDYYGQSPTSPSDVKAALQELRFDNLYNTKDVDCYWATLTSNTAEAARNGGREQDAFSEYDRLTP